MQMALIYTNSTKDRNTEPRPANASSPPASLRLTWPAPPSNLKIEPAGPWIKKEKKSRPSELTLYRPWRPKKHFNALFNNFDRLSSLCVFRCISSRKSGRCYWPVVCLWNKMAPGFSDDISLINIITAGHRPNWLFFFFFFLDGS